MIERCPPSFSKAPPLLLTLAFVLVSSAAAAGSWRSIGPEGAAIQVLAVAPGTGGTVYAVTGAGTVVASSDGAASWAPRGTLPSFYRELAVDPVRSETLYANTLNGLFKSTDGGAGWTGPLLAGYLWTFRGSLSSPEILYASRDQQIFKSTDSGLSWTATRYAGIALALAVDPEDPRIVYAAGSNGVSRSVDGGDTWQETNAGLQLPNGQLAWITALASDPRSPATLYALGLNTGIYKSTDRGAAWSLVCAVSGPYSDPRALAVDPASGTVYALDGYYGVFRSADGGASWLKVLAIYGAVALAVDGRSPGRVYAGTGSGGVYRSDDSGGSWTVATHGLRELAFTAVAADPHSPGGIFAVAAPRPHIFGFTPQFLIRSADGGATWSSPFGGGRPEDSPRVIDLAADPTRPGTWYLAIAGGVLKTSDDGRTWTLVNQGFRFIEFVRALALAPSNPEALYSIGWFTFPLRFTSKLPIVIFRSVDGAAQWRRSKLPGLEQLDFLTSLAVDPVVSSTVYVGGRTISKSLDGGMTWQPAGSGLRGSIESIAADPFTSGTLYAAVYVTRGRRVFKSTDGGATWKPAAGGLSVDVRVRRVVPDPRAAGTLYAATDRGVYVTRNGGGLWTAMNQGWEEAPVLSLAIDPLRPGMIYAGRADGLFEYSSSPAAVP